MKTSIKLLIAMTILLSSCTTGKQVSTVYDDIYYRPGDEKVFEQDIPDYTLNQSAETPYRYESVEPRQSRVPYDSYLDEKSEERYYPESENQYYQEEAPNYQEEEYYSDEQYYYPEDEYYEEGYYDENGNEYNYYYGDVNNYGFNADDYYDYSYSARLRRFHDPYIGCGYFDNYYTNMYWYNYDPFFWGTSIYMGYNWWPSYNWRFGGGWGGGWYGGWGGWGSPWGWNSGWYGGWGGWGSPWGWNGGWGWNSYGMGYNHGYWDGFYTASAIYNANDYYYNSYDGTNNFRYGPRESKLTNSVGTARDLGSRYEQEASVVGRDIAYRETSGSFSNSTRAGREFASKTDALVQSKTDSRTSRTESSSGLSTAPARGESGSVSNQVSPSRQDLNKDRGTVSREPSSSRVERQPSTVNRPERPSNTNRTSPSRITDTPQKPAAKEPYNPGQRLDNRRTQPEGPTNSRAVSPSRSNRSDASNVRPNSESVTRKPGTSSSPSSRSRYTYDNSPSRQRPVYNDSYRRVPTKPSAGQSSGNVRPESKTGQVYSRPGSSSSYSRPESTRTTRTPNVRPPASSNSNYRSPSGTSRPSGSSYRAPSSSSPSRSNYSAPSRSSSPSRSSYSAPSSSSRSSGSSFSGGSSRGSSSGSSSRSSSGGSRR